MELMEAFDRLSRVHEITLDVVGNGRSVTALESFVEERGLRSVVKLSGWQEGAALENKFRNADVFVLPSWVEGLPNAMIEAMAAGLCVVATKVGSIPDVIKHGENGLIVPPKDVEALTHALNMVVTDNELRARLAIKAHETAKKKFSVEIAVEKLTQEMFTNTSKTSRLV